VLVSLFGLPGAGKTTLAQQLAARYPFLLLSTDRLRLHYGFQSGPATLAVMFQVADELLPQRMGLIFDGIHLQRQSREAVRRLAERHQATLFFVFATAPLAVLEQRLPARVANPAETTAAGKFVITREHFLRIVSYLEPPDPVEQDVFMIDTAGAQTEQQLVELHQQLQARLL
jgi:predicted kinase